MDRECVDFFSSSCDDFTASRCKGLIPARWKESEIDQHCRYRIFTAWCYA